MDTDRIIQDLTARFAAPLPEFYRRRIIFWYDEDREFEEQLDNLHIENVKLLRVSGSNAFEIKKTLAYDDLTSNFLVWCPLSYDDLEQNWLLNIELYSGEPFRADLNTIWMDEMGLPASTTLRAQVKQYHKFFDNKDRRKKVASLAGQIRTASQLHLGVMATLCGLKDTSPSQIVCAVLTAGLDADNNPIYKSLVTFGAKQAFWALVQQATGYSEADPTLSGLTLHIFATAASRTLGKDVFAGLGQYVSVPHQAWCYDFVSEWVHGGNADSLYEAARYTEETLHLWQRFGKLSVQELLGTEFFPCINELILLKLMNEIRNEIIQVDAITAAVEKRRTMNWYDYMEDYYEGLLLVAKMQSFCLEHSAGFHKAIARDIWSAYTSDYYQMDTFYRQFHLRFYRSLMKSNDLLDDPFKHVADMVEAMYSGWFLPSLGENWSNICADDLNQYGFIPDVPVQERFYDQVVRKYKADGRVFVIISDALRYEVAASLTEQLRREMQSKVNLDSMCAVFPTITPYGMAALLPHKELMVAEKASGGLAVLADGQSTESVNRDAVLKSAHGNSVALQFKSIINMKRAERKALVQGMDVVYIYHDRIDEASHTSDNAVFPACDEAIDEIKSLVRIIVNDFSGRRILITADHGFLYTHKPLTEDDKLTKSSAFAKAVDYGRRYAIMPQGASPEYLLPVRFLQGKTQYAAFAPNENVRIRMNGSGMNYVHGGISLQEMVVPLVDFHYLKSDTAAYRNHRDDIDTKPVTIGLLSATRKISNMIFSLNFYQKDAVGDNREKAAYSLYFTDAAGTVVSDRTRIIADKTSADPQERVFRCKFNLKSLQYDSKAAYYLVIEDESGEQELVLEEFRIDIAFATDNFNFF